MIRTAVAHLRAQWAGFLALFLVVAGGTAYAANTVFSGDIVNGEVKSVDIGTGAVGTVDLANDAVTTSQIADDTVRARDVLNDSLKGADIDESTFGAVPNANAAANSAQLGGAPPSAFFPSSSVKRIDWSGGCHVDPSNPVTCSSSTYDSPVLAGLQFHATCKGTTFYPGHVTTDLLLTASGAPNSELNVGYTQGTNASTGGYYGANGTVFDAYNNSNDSSGEVGTIVYRDPGGTTVTLSFFAFEYSTAGGDVACELYANELASGA